MKMPPAFVTDSDTINVIIETPKGTSTKYTFEPETKLFKLGKILPEGLVFPLHFGFIPNTKGEDGDPLDVLVLLDEPSYPGCHVECKIIGVIEAEQTEDNETVRNDRFIAKAVESLKYSKINSIEDLDTSIIDQITYFFISYNKLSNKVFKPLKNEGPENALKSLRKGLDKVSV
jgi:inorganic pyrophosphatase